MALLWAATDTSHAQIIYVSQSYPTDQVDEYDSTTGTPINSSFITSSNGFLFDPRAMTIANGILYVVYQNSVSIQIGEFNATTGAAINTSLMTLATQPQSLAVSGSNLFVVNGPYGQPALGEYNAITGETINSSFVSGMDNPAAITVSGGDLFVISGGPSSTLSEYNAATGAMISSNPMEGQIGNIAVSGSDLYSIYGTTVSEFNAMNGALIDGTFISGLSEGGGTMIQGDQPYLAVLGNDLYVETGGPSYAEGGVGEYDATTGAPINASLVPSYSTFNGGGVIAVSPVPEPEPWALVASGIGLLRGLWCFRRLRHLGGIGRKAVPPLAPRQ